MAEELSLLGHDVQVHGLLHLNHYLGTTKFPLTRMKQVRNIPRFSRKVIQRASDLLSNLELSKCLPDVLHESYFQERGIGGSGLPRICTVHDMIHDLYSKNFGPKDNTRRLRGLTLERADAVVCVSENTRKDLIRITGINPDKTHVVHHGYEPMDREISLCGEEEKKMQKALVNPYLLYVGGRSRYKNFRGFLEGFSRVSNAHDLTIIAFGGGALKRSEMEEMAKLRIRPESIQQIDGSDELLSALYQKALAFVYPSFYEGFGFPPLEAMSAGCPVVASNASCIPEIVGDAASFFDPADSESMAVAIDGVLQSPQRRAELVERGFHRLTNFSWRKCAIKTLKVYEKVLSDN
jgi:glycosyltransferase involved in cell wall biosynthesis